MRYSFDRVKESHWFVKEGRDVSKIDLSTTVFGKKLDLPFYCSPTALQRLFHYDGEKAVGRAAAKFNTMFSVSPLSTTSMEVLAPIDAPKLFQYYYHKDKGLNDAMVEKAKEHTSIAAEERKRESNQQWERTEITSVSKF